MIDRTEQERLLIIFHCPKNIIIRKAPLQSGTKCLCASRAQNDALKATRSHSPHRNVQNTKGRDIDVLYLCNSLSLFVLTVFKSKLLCALEESFIVLTVVTKHNTQFEC